MSKHILIAVTNISRWGEHDKPTGLWFGELTHFVDAVEQAGHTWELCSPKGGAIPLDPRSLGWMFMKASDKALRADESFMARLQNTQATDDVDASGFDAIFYAGGHGTMWDFPDDLSLQRIAAEIHQRGGFVAAVCHGVSGLLNQTPKSMIVVTTDVSSGHDSMIPIVVVGASPSSFVWLLPSDFDSASRGYGVE